MTKLEPSRISAASSGILIGDCNLETRGGGGGGGGARGALPHLDGRGGSAAGGEDAGGDARAGSSDPPGGEGGGRGTRCGEGGEGAGALPGGAGGEYAMERSPVVALHSVPSSCTASMYS